jgi:TolA-binding protein
MYFNNKFKLGDSVRICNTNYKHYGVVGNIYQVAHIITDSASWIEPERIEYMVENKENVYCGLRETDICFTESPKHSLIQDLKYQLAQANQKIEELDNLYRLSTNAHCDTIDQLAAKNELLNHIDGNSYAAVINRIAKSEKTDLPKEFYICSICKSPREHCECSA